MKPYFSLFILLLILVPFSDSFSQRITLNVFTKDSIEGNPLSKLPYKKQHFQKADIQKELDRINTTLKQNGYFTNSYQTTQLNDSIVLSEFFLGPKIDSAIITTLSSNTYIPKAFKTKNHLTQPIEKIDSLLNTISSELEREGLSFSEVILKNIVLKQHTLYADLKIVKNKPRTLDKIIVKGYDNFPKSFIKFYFTSKTPFNQSRLDDLSQKTTLINFVSEIKPPEVLFKQDSTFAYIYLKPKKNSNFDGLINFSQTEKGTLLFNGYLNLELVNILNTGEQFNLLWNANGNNNQELHVQTHLPFIFNTKLSLDSKFNIHKQDSSFTTAQFSLSLNHRLTPQSSIGIVYNNVNSNNTLTNSTNKLKDYDSSFIGVTYQGTAIRKKNTKNNIFRIMFSPKIGTRQTTENSENQYKIDLQTSYLYHFNKTAIYLKNTTGYLHSKILLTNELYRIGGIKSVRGYNEQSLFTSKFSFFNLEYRINTSLKSYLYTISDFGVSDSKKLLGLGIGYNFKIKNSQVNLNLAIGNESNTQILFNTPKLSVNFKNYF